MVEVVRNKTSGKIRIFWNSSEISRYFRQRHFPIDSSFSNRTVEYSWTTRSDEVLRIVGCVDADDSIRFDLFIDDVNFKDLCTVAQLGRKFEQTPDQRSPIDESGSQRSMDSSLVTIDVEADQSSDLEQQGFRLSMVGLNSMTSGEEEISDELHSDLYSNSLTSLRHQIVSCLPQTEVMVSRAIINAFFVESQSVEPTYAFRTMDEVDCSQIEIDYIFEAMRWVRLNVDVAPRADVDDLLLQFLQMCIDTIFLLIRSEQLNSDEAARVVLSVASVLGLEFAVNVASDTIILERLPPGITKGNLYQVLSEFGDIEAISISSKTPKIGFCRYAVEDSASHVLSAYERGAVVVNNTEPEISLIGTLPFTSNLLNISSEEVDEAQGVDLEPNVLPVPATSFAQSPSFLKDVTVECNKSPTTIMTTLTNTYDFTDRRPDLEIHHARYCSSSTAACH